MTTPNKLFSGRKRSETTGSIPTAVNRLSFGGSIRLNDLLNDDDDYGFAEEATEATLLEYESAAKRGTAISDPLEMLIEEPPPKGAGGGGGASSCPSSISPLLLHGKKSKGKETVDGRGGGGGGYRSMLEDFDGGLLYSSDRLEELTGGPSVSPGSAAGGGGAGDAERGERISLGGISVGSNESREGKSSDGSSGGHAKEGKSKGIGALIDKAKHRLGGSRERDKRSTTREPSVAHAEAAAARENERKEKQLQQAAAADIKSRRPSSLAIDAAAAAREYSLSPLLHLVSHHLTQLPFAQTRLYTGAALLAATASWPGFIVGVLWGVYLSGVAFLFLFVSDPKQRVEEEEDSEHAATIVEEGCEVFDDCDVVTAAATTLHSAAAAAVAASAVQPVIVYRGWMNELPAATRYDPSAYHVNSCRCVLVRLEGATLRISRPSRAVLKHAFHTDPTLTAAAPSMVAQSIYDLTDATVSLRPRRLARLRWWSRKYPIYIKLKDERPEGERCRPGGKRRKRPTEAPRMKRSISMHPSTSGIAEAAAAGVERVRREEEERRLVGASEDEWTTTTDSEWEPDEGEARHNAFSSSLGSSSVSHARSLTEISGSAAASSAAAAGERPQLGNASASTSFRRSDKHPPPHQNVRPRGIYLFARAAREKERWFHLLREACAKARITRGSNARADAGASTVARSRSTTTMADGLFDASPPLTPSEKSRRRESSGVGGAEGEAAMEAGEMDPTTAAAREFMLYRSNQAHFARSMSEAMGVSLALLSRMAGSSSSSSTAAAAAVGGGGASAAATPAGAARAAMMREASLEEESTQSVNLGSIRWSRPTGSLPEGAAAHLVASVNAIAGRIFFDFCRDAYWCAQVKEKIQTKLATIHLPYFIENLELSSLDLGTTTPHIESVHAPSCDEWGLWVDFEMKYSGGIRLALETRVNLLKLQSATDETETPDGGAGGDGSATGSPAAWPRKHAHNRPATRYSDEDLPESPEDSPDEDFGAKMSSEKQSESTGRERAASKIVSLVESAARSAIFQKAAKLAKVAKVITDISSTRLILNVEIEAIEGTMTVNLPPPPSDRIWYAFRKRPKVSIRAVPQVGDRSVDLTTVSDWIESKLRLLIEKNLVCPNMDDIIIPVMSGNDLLKMNYNR